MLSWTRSREGVRIFRPSADSRFALIVAGEASGDLHGSMLVRAMRELDPHIDFQGIGGRRMADAGVRILVPSSDMAVVGATEVLSKLHNIARAHFTLKSILKGGRPDLLILIDYPDFNINLARSAKKFGVPVLYYISPQVWAWRRGRIRKIAERVERMAVILPFEEEIYRAHGMEVTYVGHPLMDTVPCQGGKPEALDRLGLTGAQPVLGLLPGSREDEIRNLLPPMVETLKLLVSRFPRLKCVLPLASTISADLVEPLIRNPPAPIRISEGGVYDALAACDLALVTSGTATLETAVMEVPMVVVYRVSTLSYWIGKRIIKVPFISLVNLVAQEEVVPELIQDEVTPRRLAREALAILEKDSRRMGIIEKLREVKKRLGGGGASQRTARMALDMMAKSG